MARKATKAADNVYYLARMEAAATNDFLNSREGAAEVTGIDRTKIARIELGSLDPYPEEVLLMSDTYNAPELCNHFCSHQCPLGRQQVTSVDLEELDRVTLKMLAAFRQIPGIKDGLIDITADGRITEDEKPQLKQILIDLDLIVNNAESLKLWCKKNLK